MHNTAAGQLHDLRCLRRNRSSIVPRARPRQTWSCGGVGPVPRFCQQQQRQHSQLLVRGRDSPPAWLVARGTGRHGLTLCTLPRGAGVPSASAHGSVSTLDAPATEIYPLVATEKARRLATLVELKKLYRNCLRAEYLLKQSSPVYVPPPAPARPAAATASSSAGPSAGDGDNSGASAPTAAELAAAEEDAERRQTAVDVVAEMQLTAEQIKASLRALQSGFGREFVGDTGPQLSQQQVEELEGQVRALARQYSAQLKERAAQEVPCLPFDSEVQAQMALDQRNSRYNLRPAATTADDAAAAASDSSYTEAGAGTSATGSSGAASSGGRTLTRMTSFPDRLNAAEKVAEKFVAKRIKPALQRAQEKEFVEVVQDSSRYLRGLWDRLNGAGSGAAGALPASLPLPASQKKELEERVIELRLELESLEKRLKGASKARERQLRKTAAAKRASLASQLKVMDAEVIMLSRLLAVRTLQLELLFVYRSLEEEALDIGAEELARKGVLAREGSTIELALLVAEYGLLEQQLHQVADDLAETFKAVAADHGSGHEPGAGSSSSAMAGGLAALGGLALVDDELLEGLAAEIPDLRNRVGVNDGQVYGSDNPLDPTKMRMTIKDSSDKVMEGVNFLLRGLRLLGSDVGNAGRLFTKAALGGRLKPREVSALRRTARDLFTFIPFIIILIIPMTPLGHVLVFGFIQRYFPGFFPSQFTSQRQDIMMRYEDLKQQLAVVQIQAEIEADQAELKRAAAAVARLTAPASNASSSSSSGRSSRAAAGSNSSSDAADAASNSGAAEHTGAQKTSTQHASMSGAAAAGSPVAAAVEASPAGDNSSAASSRANSSGRNPAADEEEEEDGPAAQKLKALQVQLQEVRDSVHTGVSDEEEPEQQQELGASAEGVRNP